MLHGVPFKCCTAHFSGSLKGTITPDATFQNAAAPKTPCQKYAGQNRTVRLWNGPALSVALPTEQESVGVVFRFIIIKLFVIKYR